MVHSVFEHVGRGSAGGGELRFCSDRIIRFHRQIACSIGQRCVRGKCSTC
jgi:hypothetical protein